MVLGTIEQLASDLNTSAPPPVWSIVENNTLKVEMDGYVIFLSLNIHNELNGFIITSRRKTELSEVTLMEAIEELDVQHNGDSWTITPSSASTLPQV